MPPTLTRELIEAALPQFTGSDTVYRRVSSGIMYTEGVQYLADAAGAHWLIDLIASWQPEALKDAMLREFQLWKLLVTGTSAVAVCYRDTDDEAFREEIEYTDFPLPQVSLYVEGGVLLLPSEH